MPASVNFKFISVKNCLRFDWDCLREMRIPTVKNTLTAFQKWCGKPIAYTTSTAKLITDATCTVNLTCASKYYQHKMYQSKTKPFISFFKTQTMHVKSFHTQQHCYVLVNLLPWRDLNWGQFFVHFFHGISWKNNFSKCFPRKIQLFPNIFGGKFSAEFFPKIFQE
jgi:hypothetical protein